MPKHFPVAWLTALVTILTGTDAILEQAHVLTPTESSWVGIAIAILTLVAGTVTHGQVTPLARPRDNDGRALVPSRGNE
jgi:hypothetical protein